MADHNLSINFKADPTLYMDTETFMPYYEARIDLRVLIDPQHDGRLWPKEFVEGQEHELVEDILDKLRPSITELVKNTKPYSVHGPI